MGTLTVVVHYSAVSAVDMYYLESSDKCHIDSIHLSYIVETLL